MCNDNEKNGDKWISDQTILRDLSKLAPEDCLNGIAKELKNRLGCETACILLWHEVWIEGKTEKTNAVITEYSDGMPNELKNSEIYDYGEGITGGYIFEQGKAFYGIVDMKARTVTDANTGSLINVKGINWHNMERFADKSYYKDFKSLLGLPLSIREQKIGVVKLINKIDPETNNLAAGFSKEDLDRVKNFLSIIELVIEIKKNEEQIKSLLSISERIISADFNADFNYEYLLQDIALNCRDALNLRICVIRLLKGKQIDIKANSIGLSKNSAFEDFRVSDHVIAEKATIGWDEKVFKNLGKSSQVYDLALPEVFKEFEIKSFLAVPVINQDKAVGVIECYTFLPHDFSNQEIYAIKAYGSNLVATLFQRNRINDVIAGLAESFSLLPEPTDVYRRVIELIEGYMDTKTVSLWERRTAKSEEGFEFRLESASNKFQAAYERANLHTLSTSSITAKVASKNKIKHFSSKKLQTSGVEHLEFLHRNNLESMTIVPITIGRQATAVVDVFYNHDKNLFKEEEYFLKSLAGKAATAIWIKKITQSFKEISDVLVKEQDVEVILKRITEVAREVLYADLVLLFQYDTGLGRFVPSPTVSGHLNVEKGMYAGTEKKESDFVNVMLARKEEEPLWLKSRQEYIDFCKDGVRPWREDDFWHREEIQSMAAVRLKDTMDNSVGVMFFNYRTKFNFDPLTQKVIKLFASQVTSAIVNSRFEIMSNSELIGIRNDGLLADLLDESVNLIDSVNLPLASLREQLKRAKRQIPKRDIESIIEKLTGPLEEFSELYKRFKSFRESVSHESRYANRNINSLIADLVSFMAIRLNASNIPPQLKYQPDLPEFFCDGKEIQNLFYQLISIALDAGLAGESNLEIETKLDSTGQKIIVLIRLSSSQIIDYEDDQDDGTPSRLKKCEYIAERHGGRIYKECDSTNLTFFVVLLWQR